MYSLQTRQNTDKYMELKSGDDTTPEYFYRPWLTEIKTSTYPDSLVKSPPKPPDVNIQHDRQINLDLDIEINKDFEENSPYQEGIISEIYQRPDRSQLVERQELTDLVNTNNIVLKYLPKQTDIDKILKIIKRKMLKGTHLPVTIKEIKVAYLCSPHFKTYTCILH